LLPDGCIVDAKRKTRRGGGHGFWPVPLLPPQRVRGRGEGGGAGIQPVSPCNTGFRFVFSLCRANSIMSAPEARAGIVSVVDEWVLGPGDAPFFTRQVGCARRGADHQWFPSDDEPKAYIIFMHGEGVRVAVVLSRRVRGACCAVRPLLPAPRRRPIIAAHHRLRSARTRPHSTCPARARLTRGQAVEGGGQDGEDREEYEEADRGLGEGDA
jgi:hypothetical protein